MTSAVSNRKQDPTHLGTSSSSTTALPCCTPVMKFIMTPHKLEVTLMFPKSKIMSSILPKPKEMMIQSSWNKTAAKIGPWSKLPFSKNHESKRRFTLSLHSFSPSALHSSYTLCQNHQALGCCGNEQYWWPLTNRKQFLLSAFWPMIIYTSDPALLAQI